MLRAGARYLPRLIALLVAVPGALAAAEPPLGDLVHPPRQQPSVYDQIAAADLVVRVESTRPDEDRFAVEEVLKGRPGEGDIRIVWSPGHGSYPRGERALLALGRDGEAWRPVEEVHLGGGENDGDWIKAWREYAEIAARPDRGERERALADLQRRAAEAERRNPGRSYYPTLVTGDLDAHFHLPSPLQPFADLVDRYFGAEREDERVAVLWALEESRHPEAPGFLAGLLTGGRDLGQELVPIAYGMAARRDEPDIAHLAAALRVDSDASAHRAGLAAFVRLAEPRDVDLAWRQLAEIEVDRSWEALVLAPWLAAHTPRAELTARYRGLPAPAKLALVGTATLHPEATFVRDLVLAGDDPRGRARRLSAVDLARELADAPADAPRRRAALLVAAGSPAGGWLPRWRMLQAARGEEAVVVLAWFSQHPPEADELTALAREARAAGEVDRALWAVAAAAPALLVPIVRQLDEEATAAEPWLPPRPALGDEWIESAYEAGAPAAGAVVLEPWVAASGEADAPLLLRALSRADRPRAGLLLPYFVRSPSPDALPFLRRFYDEPRLGRRTLAEALAACGDAAVVDDGFALLAHRWSPPDVAWGTAVVFRSPLPETAGRMLALDRQERDGLLRRYAKMNEAGPFQRLLLEPLLAEQVPENVSPDIRHLLARLVADGEEWARPYLDRLPPPTAITVY